MKNKEDTVTLYLYLYRKESFKASLKARRDFTSHLSDSKLSYYCLDDQTSVDKGSPKYTELEKFTVYNINDTKIQYELNKRLSRLESRNPIVRFFWKFVYWFKYHLVKKH